MTRLCNECLAAAGSPYRFYDVPSGDQCCDAALVRPSSYETIKARGLLTVRELPGNRWDRVCVCSRFGERGLSSIGMPLCL